MIMFWVSLLTISILLYVLLDGFDLRFVILFGFDRAELVGCISGCICDAAARVLPSARRHAVWSDPSRSGVRVSLQSFANAVDLGPQLLRRLTGRDVCPGHDGW